MSLMKCNVRIEEDCAAAWQEFVTGKNKATLFQQKYYLEIIATITDSELLHFVARCHTGDIVGVLPAFSKQGPNGGILNAGAFYGGHGGPIVRDSDWDVKLALTQAFFDFAFEQGFASATLICSLFDETQDMLCEIINPDFVDRRIGQLTFLPSTLDDGDHVLMDNFHPKTRNMVRKAQKSNLTLKIETSEEAWDFLYQTHVENMHVIGGQPKPRLFFDLVKQSLNPGDEYQIYTASLKGSRVAALLLFYSCGIVEYYTPVILANARSLQPMSLLVFSAMKDAVNMGYNIWNWGGTGVSQQGVYRFKNRWGALDKEYQYFTKVYDDSLLRVPQNALTEHYKFFFTFPFQHAK